MSPELKSEIQNPKSKIAFVFPGQGSQCIGMGKGFYEGYAAAKQTFDEAGSVIGLDMARLCFEGPEAELNLTRNTPPGITSSRTTTTQKY